MNIKEIIIRIKKIKVNAIEHIDIEPGLRWIFLFKKIFIFAKKKSWARRKRKREKLSPHQASDGSVVGSKISWFMFIGILCIFLYIHICDSNFWPERRWKNHFHIPCSRLTFSQWKKTSSDYFLWCFFSVHDLNF